MSNHRIKGISKGQVSFSMKDYRKGGRKKVIKLSEAEFIRRFSLHILPKGFTKIRHYGILSGSSKKKYKALIDEQLGEVIQPKSTPTLHRICPACKKGVLETVYSFDQRGPPADWRSLFEHLLS